MKKKRRICYVTGTRADFGLMRNTLEEIRGNSGLELTLIVTGMHLSSRFGLTVKEIQKSGFNIGARVQNLQASDSGAAMARSVGRGILGISEALEHLRPDIVLVLGDRGEMLAGALAAAHTNIPVAHIHGGDQSGTIDESVRHAITKLAHLHFAATKQSARRIRAMGEDPKRIFCVGAPGLDDLFHQAIPPRDEICRRYNLDVRRPYALILQHPVTQEVNESRRQMRSTLDAVRSLNIQTVICMPNGDAGRSKMEKAVDQIKGHPDCHIYKHLPRADFLGTVAGSAVLVGNSSAGIIEAASLGVPVVNIGTRQMLRERNRNVVDVGHNRAAIRAAIEECLKKKTAKSSMRFPSSNLYGDGQTGKRIAKILRDISLEDILYKKLHL